MRPSPGSWPPTSPGCAPIARRFSGTSVWPVWRKATEDAVRAVLDLLRLLANNPIERVAVAGSGGPASVQRREAVHELVEGLYDFWRSFDRFMVAHLEDDVPEARHSYRDFNRTMATFAMLVRGLYRDVAENIGLDRPRVYRQVSAGCEVGLVVGRLSWPVPDSYRPTLAGVPFVRHVVIDPPFITDPPMNKRTGAFVGGRPGPGSRGSSSTRARWVCYPVIVGPPTRLRLREPAFRRAWRSAREPVRAGSDERGSPADRTPCISTALRPERSPSFGELPTVFHADREAGLLVAAVPAEDRFGYFGYLKKMVLTLHNVLALEAGRLPFHGAYVRVVARRRHGGRRAHHRRHGRRQVRDARGVAGAGRRRDQRDLRIIADDMGSLTIGEDGDLRGYGTEIGAFVRLDDLQPGLRVRAARPGHLHEPHRVRTPGSCCR